MCDYSLHNVKSRSAKIGDKLTTRNFGTGTRGFAAPEDVTTAVCVLPGTELAFAQEPAKKIRHLKGHDEGAGDPGDAHEIGIDHFAHHPQDTAGERRSSHRAGGFEHLRHRRRSLEAGPQSPKEKECSGLCLIMEDLEFRAVG